MARATRWTDEKIKALRLPAGKAEQRVLVAPGLYLYLRQRASGEVARQWQFRAQVGGVRRWLSLGAFPSVGLGKAAVEMVAHRTAHEAAKKGDAKALKDASSRLNSSCNNCHGPFRDS